MPVDLRLLPATATPPRVVAVPVGSMEQHCGLPLGTDCLIAERLTWKACEAAEGAEGFTCAVAPPICYGFSPEWEGQPGTVTLPLGVFTGLVKAVVVSLWRWGVERVVVVNAHGGNTPALRAALAEAAAEAPTGRLVALIDYWRVAGLQLGHASRVERAVLEALGLGIPVGPAECPQAGVAGEGLYIYTRPVAPLEAIEAQSGPEEVRDLHERVARAIIRFVRADATRHWIG